MTDRSTFHRLLGGVLCASAIGARAQAVNRVYRVGVLRPTPAPPTLDPVSAEIVRAKAFARMGYVEGRNFHLDQRYADSDPQRPGAPASPAVDVGVARAGAGTRADVVWGQLDGTMGAGCFVRRPYPEGRETRRDAIDQPRNLGFTMNLATASAIGLEIPQSIVLRADEVIR